LGLVSVAEFATMVSNIEKDKFTLILEPNTNDGSINDPILNLACLDSSLGKKI
jgi:hypothetical protein